MTAIANPQSAMAATSDFRTGFADNGIEHVYGGKTTGVFRANAAVDVGEVVTFVVPTAANPLSVTPASAVNTLCAGVAETSAAAGDNVTVCLSGNTFVIAGGSVSAGNVLGGGSSAKATAVTVDATILAGAILGFALADGSADDLIPCYIAKR